MGPPFRSLLCDRTGWPRETSRHQLRLCPVTAMVWKEPKFPTEDHPDWNPEEPYKDPVALLEHRELLVRQKFVRMEKAKARRCATACISHHCIAVPARSALLGDGALLLEVIAHVAAWLAHSCSTLHSSAPHSAVYT